MLDNIPRLAIIAVVILAIIGAAYFWWRWSKSSKPSNPGKVHEDKELTENVKAQRYAAAYADNVAKGLEPEDDEHEGAVTDEYVREVARGLDAEDAADDEDDEDDDEEYEPMD